MAAQDGFVKRLRGIADDDGGFIVDGFNFVDPETKHYFLTHFHSDHTTGLHASFDIGTIYCSNVTAELVVSVTGVKKKVVRALEIGETTIIQGVEVTPLNANHCPGAVMFHFRDQRSGRVVLHTGDFRASTAVCNDPRMHELLRQSGPVDLLYLDTTYCKPGYTFPDQAEVCAAMARIVREELEREPKTLFVVGSYSIGKENAIEAVARAASSCAFVSFDRARSLRLSGRWDDSLYTESDSDRTLVHVSSLLGGDNWHDAAKKTLKDLARFNAIVGFRPTGASHRSGNGHICRQLRLPVLALPLQHGRSLFFVVQAGPFPRSRPPKGTRPGRRTAGKPGCTPYPIASTQATPNCAPSCTQCGHGKSSPL